jgi:hypothetical protein
MIVAQASLQGTVLSPRQLEMVRQLTPRTDSLDAISLELGFASVEDLQRAVGDVLGMEYVD